MSNTAGLSKEWYRDVADLSWKEFFRKERERDAFINYSHLSQPLFDACRKIYLEKCTAEDQRIVRAYYDRKWGDGIFALEEFAERECIPIDWCWHTVRRVRRFLMYEMKLLERNGGALPR